MGKRQFKMYLDDEFLARLEEAAETSGRRSAQDVAEDVLGRYLSVWTDVQQSVQRAVKKQIKEVIKEQTAAEMAKVKKEKPGQIIPYEQTDKIPVLARRAK